MITKTEEEWDNILTEEFLRKEYIDNYIAINKIAQNLKCGTLRVSEKIKEFNLTRRRVAHNRRMDAKEIIERAGFKFIEEAGTDKDKRRMVKIICHCGQKFTTTLNRIVVGQTKSCGCSWTAPSKQRKGYKDLLGKQFNIIRYGAERRNILFDITAKDVWDIYEKQDRKCLLTNIYMTWDSKYGPGNASVDRIDNLKGYTKDNIQIILKDVNMMKRHHSQDYLLYLCYLIGKNYNNGDNFLWWEKENISKHEH